MCEYAVFFLCLVCVRECLYLYVYAPATIRPFLPSLDSFTSFQQLSLSFNSIIYRTYTVKMLRSKYSFICFGLCAIIRGICPLRALCNAKTVSTHSLTHGWNEKEIAADRTTNEITFRRSFSYDYICVYECMDESVAQSNVDESIIYHDFNTWRSSRLQIKHFSKRHRNAMLSMLKEKWKNSVEKILAK